MTEHRNNGRNARSHANDIHDRISNEAKALCEANEVALRDAGEFPALGQLLESARAALERGIPARFDHEGKTYFLRVSVGLARLMVFDTPASFKPMAMAMTSSFAEYGHTPEHKWVNDDKARP